MNLREGDSLCGLLLPPCGYVQLLQVCISGIALALLQLQIIYIIKYITRLLGNHHVLG